MPHLFHPDGTTTDKDPLSFDLCIIDCDGVIYDSNNLKTEG